MLHDHIARVTQFFLEIVLSYMTYEYRVVSGYRRALGGQSASLTGLRGLSS